MKRSSDLPAMMWACRQKYWAILNGPVPVVTAHQTGAGAFGSPSPNRPIRSGWHGKSRKQQLGRLELQLQGVYEIPGAKCIERRPTATTSGRILTSKVYVSMKMSMNHFEAPLLTESLGNLRVLWLKASEIKQLNEDVDNLQKLRLILEENGLRNCLGRFRD